MTRAELSLEQAEAADAAEFAPLEIRQARKAFEQARAAVDDGDNLAARRAAEIALTHAQLAEALAAAAGAEAAADKAESRAARLQQELDTLQESAP